MEYPQIKQGMRSKITAIKIGNKTLKLVTHESDNYITIYIGGHTKYCIYGFVIKQGSIMAERYDVSIGDFSKIQFTIECSLEHVFRRGIDTNIILKVFLSYIYKHYPYVKQLNFEDASYRRCDTGEIIDLAEMSYITTGKTWYEKHFGASVAPQSRAMVANIESKFQEIKGGMSWDECKSYITNELPIEEAEMKQLYDTVKTWQDFFGPLRDRIGIESFCPFVAPWLEIFMKAHFKKRFIQIPYHIPIKENIIEFTEVPYTHGGKRFTRKRIEYRY